MHPGVAHDPAPEVEDGDPVVGHHSQVIRFCAADYGSAQVKRQESIYDERAKVKRYKGAAGLPLTRPAVSHGKESAVCTDDVKGVY